MESTIIDVTGKKILRKVIFLYYNANFVEVKSPGETI